MRVIIVILFLSVPGFSSSLTKLYAQENYNEAYMVLLRSTRNLGELENIERSFLHLNQERANCRAALQRRLNPQNCLKALELEQKLGLVEKSKAEIAKAYLDHYCRNNYPQRDFVENKATCTFLMEREMQRTQYRNWERSPMMSYRDLMRQ